MPKPLEERQKNTEVTRKWREQNSEKYAAQRERYYSENKEKCLERSRLWREANP
jgi:hypothetical protein